MSVAQVAQFPGGLGSPGLLLLGNPAFERGGAAASFLAHEVAHAWFGNELGLDLSDDSHPWLSEAFAQYWDALYLEHKEGRTTFVQHMRSLAEHYYAAAGMLPDRPLTESLHGDPMYMALAYDKGAFVLHALRGLVGDEAFFGMMRRYVDEHRGRIVRQADFQRAAEVAAGEPLDWFFTQWLDRPGVPRYRINSAIEQPGGAPGAFTTQVEVEQVGTAFRMPLTLRLETDGQSIDTRITVSDAVTTVTLASDAEPRRVCLDPDYWVLKHPRAEEWEKAVTR